MIIRRKMPRLLSRRPIGIIGLRVLRQSSDHVRRMVVSKLPTSFSNNSVPDVQPTEQPPAYAPFDTPLAPAAPDPQSRMPKDLQAIFDMHKALGHVKTPTKSLRERIAERKASEQQAAPLPSSRIQKRPDNVRYEPDRIQRSPTPSIESDIEPLPEMPPPKSNRVRSFVEYVNFSDGMPESRQSDATDSDDSGDAESSTSGDDADWLSEDDLPDAMPGSYAVDDISSSTPSLNSAAVAPNPPVQRQADDDHPTLVDMPLETLHSEPNSHSETTQRQFDPIEPSDEDLLPPRRFDVTHDDGSPETFSDDANDVYTETVMDSGDSERKAATSSTNNPPVQRSSVPLETSHEDLSPSVRNNMPRIEQQPQTFLDNDTSHPSTVMDSGDKVTTPPTSNPSVQRSFEPLEVSDETLAPPSPQRDGVSRADVEPDDFSDNGDEVSTETVIDSGSDPVAGASIQRSFEPPEVSHEDLTSPSHYDAPSYEFSDDNDGYTETNMVSENRESKSVSGPPIQRSFAPMETNAGDLLPPSRPEIHQPEVDSVNRQEARMSPPIQRNFDLIEADTNDLLPPASYSGDTRADTPSSSVQRSVDDEWEETSPLSDIDEPPFENHAIPQREFDSVETSTEDLYPPSYQQSDRPDRGTENTEQPTVIGHSQPRRMTVSRSESPVAQRFPLVDSETTDSDVSGLQRDDNDTSGLPYQALDLGQALLDAGMVKPKQDTPSQQQSFTVLMPPIGRAHHTPNSTAQRPTVEQSIQRAEAPTPSQSSPSLSSSSVDAGLLDALGMPQDTVIQRSGPQMPAGSEIPSQESSTVVQRIDEGIGESSDSGEALGNDSSSSPNVEEMAKQVYRILQRRFRIERERSKGR